MFYFVKDNGMPMYESLNGTMILPLFQTVEAARSYGRWKAEYSYTIHGVDSENAIGVWPPEEKM